MISVFGTLMPWPNAILWPLLAFGITFLMIAALLPHAERLGLLDIPDHRKKHSTPTPVVGGLAMLIGISITSYFGLPRTPATVSLIAASSVIVAIGMYDDRNDVPWYIRIGVHFVAALIMVLGGNVVVEQIGPMLGMHSTGLGFMAVPLTVFATVGLINAMNLIDGSDGLAGSLALAALIMLTAASLYAGNRTLAASALVVAGGVAGFLFWNLRFPWRKRARTFMGDAGSGFLGLVVAWLSFRLTQNPGHPVNPVLALWLLPIPVMDCLVVIANRLQQRRSPFAPGRDHIHHFMLDAGYTPMQLVIFLTGLSLLMGLVAAQCLRWHLPGPLLLSVYLTMCAGWYCLAHKRQRAIRFFKMLRGGLTHA